MSIDSTANNPEPDPHPHLPPGKSLFDRVVQGLRRKDSKLNEYCAVVLIGLQKQMGLDVVALLANEAVGKDKHPDFRVRILEVIHRIGEPLGMSFFELHLLMYHPVERVSRKAMEVISALSPANMRNRS